MIRRKLVWEGLRDVSWNLIQQYLPLSKTPLDIAVQRGHHTVSDVTGRDAAVSIVMSVQMLHGSIRSTLFLHYLRGQCGTSDVTSHLLSDRPAALAELTSRQQHGIT